MSAHINILRLVYIAIGLSTKSFKLKISREKHIMWKIHLLEFLGKLSIFLESVNKSLQRIVYLFEKCRGKKTWNLPT